VLRLLQVNIIGVQIGRKFLVNLKIGLSSTLAHKMMKQKMAGKGFLPFFWRSVAQLPASWLTCDSCKISLQAQISHSTTQHYAKIGYHLPQ